MLSMVAPPYISEISPPEVRGTLPVLEEFSVVSGIVVAFWLTYGTRFIQSDWVMEVAFPAADGTCFRSGRRDLFPALFVSLVDVERQV